MFNHLIVYFPFVLAQPTTLRPQGALSWGPPCRRPLEVGRLRSPWPSGPSEVASPAWRGPRRVLRTCLPGPIQSPTDATQIVTARSTSAQASTPSPSPPTAWTHRSSLSSTESRRPVLDLIARLCSRSGATSGSPYAATGKESAKQSRCLRTKYA